VRVEYRNVGGTVQLTDMVELIAVVIPTDPIVPTDPIIPTDPIVPIVPTDPIVPVVPTVTVNATPTLGTSATVIDYGHSATLRLSIAPASAMPVRLEKRASSLAPWTVVTTLTTDANGIAQYSVSPLSTTEYRTVVVGTGIASNSVTVTVRARATIHSTKRIVHKASTVFVSGTVSNAGGSRLVLQRVIRGHWVSIRTIATDSAGRYLTRLGLSSRGTHSYRVVATSSTVRVASSTLHIHVR
jgi:hypothetical protein